MSNGQLGLEGEYAESDLPLLIRRAGMSEWDNGIVRILDRRGLPQRESYLDCRTTDEVAIAIEDMAIQGAFSLAIAAGYGLALASKLSCANSESIRTAKARLLSTRPTGLALNRMLDAAEKAAHLAAANDGDVTEAILAVVNRAAETLARQGWKTGQRAANLLDNNACILTHCFPDRSYAYMLMEAAKLGKELHVICSETRPYLQGARLTSLCAQQAGFKATVIADGMSAFLMRRGEIDAFITAADRVCMDGTVCNKIGTYQHALAAREHDVPYYALRQSGPDRESAGEVDVEIEFRSGDALLHVDGKRTAPIGVQGLYPGFDITPPEFVRAIVTDRGIFEPAEIHTYVDADPFVTDAIL